MTSEHPAVVGRYQIVRPLGAGAMGEVFLALDPNIDRYLAIKTVRLVGPPNEIEDRKQRLLREAKAAGRLLHPNVVTLFDAGEHEGLLYLAFEFVEGQDLSHRMVANPPLNLGEVLRLVREVASALDVAHFQGIVHRDIKPSNILIGPLGEAKVADFGIAKLAGAATQLTQTGSVVGSPQYMSPEQIRGEALDGRSDLFSLGVVFYELLAHQRPFDGDTLSTLVFQILSKEPIGVGELRAPLPEKLTALVHRLLAKAPTDRPKAQELVEEIDDLQKSLSIVELAMPMDLQAEVGSTPDHQPTTQLPPPIPKVEALNTAAGNTGKSNTVAPNAEATVRTAHTQATKATAPPPMPPPPAPMAGSAGTYAVPAAQGRKIPVLLTLAAFLLLALGWLGARYISDQRPEPGTETQVAGHSNTGAPSTVADPIDPPTTEEATGEEDELDRVNLVDDASGVPPETPLEEQQPPQNETPHGEDSSEPSTPPQNETAQDETTQNAPPATAPDPQATLPQTAPPQTTPPPSTSSPSTPPSSEPTSSEPSRTTPPPSGTSLPVPPRSEATEPLQAPPLALPPRSAEDRPLDPDVARFIRATQRARLELDTGMKLRFDVEPKDTIVRLWRRGDRRAIVQGQVNLFQAGKKKANDLSLPAEGDYLVGLFRDGLPEYAILIHASNKPGSPATVIRSKLSQNTAAGPRLLKVGRVIAFRGEPRDALIYIDDIEQGRASAWPGGPRPASPLNLRLQPGPHTLRIEAPGYEPYTLRLEVQDGLARKRVIEYQLQEP